MAATVETGDPATLFDQGNACFERGETDAAIAAYRRCVAGAPNSAGAWYNLGNALLKIGCPVDAIDSFVACLRLAPDFGGAYVNLAEALRGLGLLEQAQWAAEAGIQHLPALPEAYIVLANTLHDRCEYPAAEAVYRQVLAVAPDHPGVLSSLGNTLHAMGRLADGLEAHNRAVFLAPDGADFHFNRAATLLAAGDYARGWAEYEWRWRRSQARPRGFGSPWRGEDIAGRTILLHAEQGLGDTLQFIRYAPLVAERGARVVLEVQPPLVTLLRAMPGVAQVVARGDPLPPFDRHCPLLSLPHVFDTSLATIPAQLPYLRADPSAVGEWSRKLPDEDALRVGIVWSGSTHSDDAGAHLIDRRRSITLATLGPLGDVPGVQLVSLQQHIAADAKRTPSAGPALIDPMADVTDFADTAALVGNLDLVISVDTSVAHLAGALGQRIWLLSRYDGCWRWLHDRTDSPWYPSMRIYRQQRPHDWSAVIAAVRDDLAKLADRSGHDGQP